MLLIWERGKPAGVPGEKSLGTRKKTNNKLNPHMTLGPGIELGTHRWEASALTTARTLLTSEDIKMIQCFQQGDDIFFFSFLPPVLLKNLRVPDFVFFLRLAEIANWCKDSDGFTHWLKKKEKQ